MKYELTKTIFDEDIVKATTDDGTIWWIPIDPANSDYQAYLATLASESAPTA